MVTGRRAGQTAPCAPLGFRRKARLTTESTKRCTMQERKAPWLHTFRGQKLVLDKGAANRVSLQACTDLCFRKKIPTLSINQSRIPLEGGPLLDMLLYLKGHPSS